MSEVDVLVAGAGVVGGHAVEFLARRPEIRSIVVVDVDGKRAEAIAWRAKQGAYQEGYSPVISGRGVDLGSIDATRDAIEAIKPKVIFHAATILTVPEMSRGLKPETFTRVRTDGMAGFVAAHAFLAANVQAAIKEMKPRPKIVMAPFPDFTIPILSHLGEAPLTGIGNVDNMSAEIACTVAEMYGTSPLDVQPLIIAHHAVGEWFGRTGNADKAPWYARVLVSGNDVTGELDLNEVMKKTSARTRGTPTETRVASSAVKHILAILSDRGTFLHSAGAKGLPGGWPARLFGDRIELVSVPGITHEAALEMNVAGQRASGLDEILDDGTLVYNEACARMMDELFGIKISRVAASDLSALALDIRAALTARIAAGG